MGSFERGRRLAGSAMADPTALKQRGDLQPRPGPMLRRNSSGTIPRRDPVTRNLRRKVARIALALLASGWISLGSGSLLAEEDVPELMSHIWIVQELPTHITWYTPRTEGMASDVFIYPTLGIRENAERKLVLRVFQNSPDLLHATRLQFVVDRETLDVPLDPARHRVRFSSSPSRFDALLLLDDQESLIRRIALARHASIAFEENGQLTPKYDLAGSDLDNFRRIVALRDMQDLPPGQEAPAQDVPAEGTYVAGQGGVTNPRLIPESRVSPKYPSKALKNNVEGIVVLSCLIHKDGSVGDITVVKSPGGGFGLEEAAIKAVNKWKYKPGLLNGAPVDVWFTVIVDFKMPIKVFRPS
jgi:TonB family protein